MSALWIVGQLGDIAPDIELDYQTNPPESAETLVFMLGAIDDCRDDLAKFRAKVVRDLISTAGEKRFSVEGFRKGGEVEIKRSMRRTGWRHDELVPAVVSRIIDERETLFDTVTGELYPPAFIGQNVAARLRDCISFGQGKVTGLRAIGLQPDEFCHEDPAAWSVKLPPR